MLTNIARKYFQKGYKKIFNCLKSPYLIIFQRFSMPKILRESNREDNNTKHNTEKESHWLKNFQPISGSFYTNTKNYT